MSLGEGRQAGAGEEEETCFVIDTGEGEPVSGDSGGHEGEAGGREAGDGNGERGVRRRRGTVRRREKGIMGGCTRCGKRCEGFLTDREQRKVWGIGILYVLGFPLLLLMVVVGSLKVGPGTGATICTTFHSLWSRISIGKAFVETWLHFVTSEYSPRLKCMQKQN